MKKSLPFIICYLVFAISFTSIAQATCPALVDFALQSTDEFCSETGRNQACFGHVNLTAEGQPDAVNFEFIEVGDIVDVASIRTLRLSTLDSSAGAWGVVLMRIQANLPNSTPGQNVTFMLFGDTELRNAATSIEDQNPPTLEAQVSSSIDANVRVGPNTTMAVLASIPNGTTVTATGISPNGEWVRILLPTSNNDQTGWISRQLLIPSDDTSTLNVIQPGQPQFGPMQAFYLSTGIGQPSCNEAPENGLLVQTPKGVGEINLLVNEVEISMGSTVFLTATRDEDDDEDGINVNSMEIKTIEGTAITRINGRTQVATGGSQFEVIYDDEGFIEEVSQTERLEFDEIDELPFENLDREIDDEEYEEISDEELEILEEYGELFDVVDIDDTDELLDYIDEFGDDDLIEYLQEELDIEYFDGETAEFFEEELDFDIEGFEDDEDFDEFDEFDEDFDGDEFDEDFDEFDEFDENFDEFDEFDENFDEFDEFDEDFEEDFDEDFEDDEDFDDEDDGGDEDE